MKFPWIVLLSLTTSLQVSFAQQAPDGPGFELPENDIRQLLVEIQNQGLVGASEISLDSLRDPRDKEAYDLAVDRVSTRFQWAIYGLSELKRNLVRYSVIVNQAGLAPDQVATITQTSSAILQQDYNNAIWSITDWPQRDEADVLQKCISEICVIDVSNAYRELLTFSQSINQDLDFRKMASDTKVIWSFEDPILKASFSKTFKSMIPDNQDHNMFAVLAAGIFTPLSVVGVTTIDLLKAAGSAIFNPRYEHIQLSVNKLGLNYDTYRTNEKALFAGSYTDAASGARAANYVAPTPPTPDPTPSPSPTPTPIGPPTVDAKLRAENRGNREKLNPAARNEMDSDLKNSIERNDPDAIDGLLALGASPSLVKFNDVFSALDAAYQKTEYSTYKEFDHQSTEDRLKTLIRSLVTYGYTSWAANVTSLKLVANSPYRYWRDLENLLVETIPVNESNEDGVTPLMAVASVQDQGPVKYLLEHGANVNERDSGGNTALFYARGCSENAALIEAAGGTL